MNVSKNHQKSDVVKTVTGSILWQSDNRLIRNSESSVMTKERASCVVQTKSPARPHKFSQGLRSKTETRMYMLFSASGENILFAIHFFINTLNSDKMIKTAIAKRKGSFIKSIPDQGGWHELPHKLNDTTT